jgi:hypothetical protein
MDEIFGVLLYLKRPISLTYVCCIKIIIVFSLEKICLHEGAREKGSDRTAISLPPKWSQSPITIMNIVLENRSSNFSGLEHIM